VALVSHGPFPEKGHDLSQKSWLRPACLEPPLEPDLLVELVVEAPAQSLFGEDRWWLARREMDGVGRDRGDEVGVGNRLPDHPHTAACSAVTGSAKSTAPIALAKFTWRGSQ
jgi:hypothetical protein